MNRPLLTHLLLVTALGSHGSITSQVFSRPFNRQGDRGLGRSEVFCQGLVNGRAGSRRRSVRRHRRNSLQHTVSPPPARPQRMRRDPVTGTEAGRQICACSLHLLPRNRALQITTWASQVPPRQRAAAPVSPAEGPFPERNHRRCSWFRILIFTLPDRCNPALPTRLLCLLLVRLLL